MPPDVIRLKGQSCSYHKDGRCTRTRNPAQSAACRCALLEGRRQLGLQALDRMERVQRLSDPQDRAVARRHLAKKNLRALADLTCTHYISDPCQGRFCRQQFLVYCLLLLPECLGRCEHYLRQNPPPGESPCLRH